MNVDHRGFSPLPKTLQVIKLDATLPSDLKWEVAPHDQTLWELEFGQLTPQNLPSFQIAVRTFVQEFNEVDRAILDGEPSGLVKIHVKAGTDRILGATVVARHAGEMISEVTLAMAGKLGLGMFSGTIHPYPTQAQAFQRLGDAYSRTRLTPFIKSLFTKWLALTR